MPCMLLKGKQAAHLRHYLGVLDHRLQPATGYSHKCVTKGHVPNVKPNVKPQGSSGGAEWAEWAVDGGADVEWQSGQLTGCHYCHVEVLFKLAWHSCDEESH